MNRKNKYILSLLFLTSSALASVELEIDEDHDDVMRAVQQGLVQPFSSLQSKVNEQLHGRIIRVELEEDDDIWIYELKLIGPNNNIVRVEYDAQTLTILEIKGRGLENIIKVDQ
ncbi:PepSY domain-containing protein [Photobacterium sp. DNB23_23_1]|uniref:PepSY domain-containing protein n=1 Tax=Photobacterium pectinilyticum TaxID=2906793 RepID=A0ABT1N7B7_9GAMM|nr:PepSY domain-containing protein [Photobacterium sp. ZSDE20]MCQ1059124.1 PepSY domain-containing protein [Photobacterium sp. ZSDE20]MDD1824355.1 PepSY domain-containing protein [Photobacterium sp. ZSDE20]